MGKSGAGQREETDLATIIDVAQRAGVSIKTVSRVLNREPHVRDAVQQKVLEAVEALGYRPNQSARRMAGRKSFLVAYLYSNPSPAYTTGVQSGAALCCRELGYHLVVEPVLPEDADLFPVIDRLVSTLAPDLLLVAPPLSDDADFLALMERKGTPLARIAGVVPGPGKIISVDDREAAYRMTRHLIGMGHRRIGVVRPPQDHLSAQARFDGFVDAMEEAGLPVDPHCLAPGRFTFESGKSAAARLLALAERPTAIFATNDEMALGVLAQAHDMGLSLPQDLSVAGFDDIPATRTCWPLLTTIRQPLEELGRLAILEGIGGADMPRPLLDYRLVERDSVARIG